MDRKALRQNNLVNSGLSVGSDSIACHALFGRLSATESPPMVAEINQLIGTRFLLVHAS